MNRDLSQGLRVGIPILAVGAVLIGLVAVIDSDRKPEEGTTERIGASGISLVAYDTCDSALTELRRAALPLVGPYGLFGETVTASATDAGAGPLPPAAGPAAPRQAAPAEGRGDSAAGPAAKPAEKAEPGHSTTNVHEGGVDEPDLVKTDGKRLITIVDGRLRVVDVASHAMTATLIVPGGTATQLLISGDRALVVTGSAMSGSGEGKPAPGTAESRLVLVDLTGAGRVLATLAVDGGYIDARQTGAVARVVLRSVPRMPFVFPNDSRSEGEALRRNRESVEHAPIEDWLPHYEWSSGARHRSGMLVDCSAVSRPEHFSGTSMLTVLTFDLNQDLGAGDPVSIVADGDTVYGTASSLYVADDHYPHAVADGPGRPRFAPSAQRTEVYQFDISAPGKPVYLASGGVDGALLNQYSLSEHADHLRIATTTDGQSGKTESMITVLARRGDELVQVGRVGGLGVSERIYAVRFFGPVGYVVTFRQTDPLYTVDLSNPAQPRVTGELKITGYSAYLHQTDPGRLIGVGQEATERGRQTGTQISLFDTANLAGARRLAQFQLPGGRSEVEFDPHAFLYWKEKGLVVVPVTGPVFDDEGRQAAGALVLRLSADTFTELGTISHPADPNRDPNTAVRRAVVIGDELWTVSESGAMANDLERLTQRTWIPFG
jgi:uncharacterized secreted protein with C-terminal beta-propeller domain